jgi:hypothetical protein
MGFRIFTLKDLRNQLHDRAVTVYGWARAPADRCRDHDAVGRHRRAASRACGALGPVLGDARASMRSEPVGWQR